MQIRAGMAFVQEQVIALCGGAPGQRFHAGDENLILARQTDHT